MDKHTPLYDRHLALGGRMVSFAGHALPVQYPAGVIEEHMAVRKRAGLFDVSHMGEALLTGPGALNNLNRWLTNDFTDLPIGRVRYSPLCNEEGGVLDDLIVYRLAQDRYFIVVNASNREKDMGWMRGHLSGDANLADISEETAQLALQGPASKAIISRLTPKGEIPKKYYSFVEDAHVAGIRCLISRTGYTGEFGYEMYVHPARAEELWDALLSEGAAEGLIPCGLGARDTLRLEAGMPLYGHEMDETVSPLEAGLAWAVKPEGRSFIGRDAILSRGAPRARVGLKILGRGIAREHQAVLLNGEEIGRTTSGTHLPFLGGAYAMALLDARHTDPGTRVAVDVRGRPLEAEIVPLPFYSNTK